MSQKAFLLIPLLILLSYSFIQLTLIECVPHARQNRELCCGLSVPCPLAIRTPVHVAGGRHATALTVDGEVFSWGEGDDRKLGHFSKMNCDKPRLIEALKTKRIRDIACGSSHSAALTSSGELYTWGLGEYGRLGHGDNTTQLKPKMVKVLLGHRVIQVACGSKDAQTLALTDEGESGITSGWAMALTCTCGNRRWWKG
ncbi:E3 ubiquitin-protein ligase HERC2-like isoform X2 [Piliocolobus tephrosceles]|uniref:E3 ubiquitin-protein ligase HERC2-like isoform X2 n=1 Tax=Piliocolobus tephrosceles TaxID=591936 RepID=UPI000E6B4D2D|nr:E3 ubiquitin-protein ligase HERC2-like isoform X2 [Piliocolobus tephrosceles]